VRIAPPWLPNGQPFSVTAFTIRSRKIVGIEVLGDPVRLPRLGLTRAQWLKQLMARYCVSRTRCNTRVLPVIKPGLL